MDVSLGSPGVLHVTCPVCLVIFLMEMSRWRFEQTRLLGKHTANRRSGSIHNSYHTESWEQMSAIKSKILRIWDGAPAPVKLSCIKFAQRVVLAQTASNGMEQKVGGLSRRVVIVADLHTPLVRCARHLTEHDSTKPPLTRSPAA